ncbi:S8 family serine peptidase [Aquabacterium sp. A7-Y]|uniref:S8 family serine peptidase n=1 Tax=Aquabacterium sp. A7-Y TaxID=1349605 RepID=UPI00223E19E5|nr:S8 family serine peptidase [Aquabacterium sp. A7-Y]MCW7539807.1 S8 family serine peptidase [Aquabacterium sp. A7-Y]
MASSSSSPSSSSSAPSRYLILPTAGFVTGGLSSATAEHALRQLLPMQQEGRASLGGLSLRVLASAASDGTKVVELTPDEAALVQSQLPGLRIVPERRYTPARAPRVEVLNRVAPTQEAPLRELTVRIVADGAEPRPLSDCMVVVLTDADSRTGAQGVTDAQGEVRLQLPGSVTRAPLVVAYPLHGGWPREWQDVELEAVTQLHVVGLDRSFADARRRLYGEPEPSAGAGVKVAVIDTGVGPHADLPVAVGRNTTLVEPVEEWHDEEGHGTHVAGVIAAQLREGGFNLAGEAPQVALHAYRVFERGEGGASNAAIREAIRQAVLDGCDIINMSLGGAGSDPAISEAIQFARLSGAICVCAAGNEGGPVSYPANDPLSLAVSALGVKDAWPEGSAQARHLSEPPGEYDTFVARFSNRGPQIRLGAPGVGIVSTIPQDRWGVMDGTSMASPVAAGVLARALAASPELLQAPRDAKRSEAILALAAERADDLGFAPTLQGKGLAR